ncbi:unnamed protein product [Heligmosomoides polygyrus]|uniref:Methyltransf_11 domain-containing protein n=1 Tax=Heligmosomoides polygyrus TaxID=6339 RepID=A0A3P7ZE54_HELPZ|nr:unnamed protein product [Heligmosomoides polygyrus]
MGYGDYGVLGDVLEKYLKPSDKILQIGCGNSQLAAQLYDNAFRSVHSIDTESAVIEEQRQRNRERPELEFSKDDATSMSFGDDTFSAVIDKGTLDALLPPGPSLQQVDAVQRMFREVQRVLKVGEIIFKARNQQFLLRVHEIENRASGFPMPVFVLVATKLRTTMSNLQLLFLQQIEFCRAGSDCFEKISVQDDLLSAILSEQEFNQFVHLCSRKLNQEASIAIESRHESGPRYRLHIVDDANAKSFRSYAVFVVPLGREGEWIFSTEKGRRTLREQTGKDRLAVVTLSRSQTYSSLQQVQDELGPFATRFDPRENGGLIDFLSTGSVDVRETRASGESALNGKWTVEDVVVEGQDYRRLIFLSSSNIVQSETPLKTKKGKKTVDLEKLSCDHHLLMLVCEQWLAIFASDISRSWSRRWCIAAVLSIYLFQSAIEGVELDPDVVKIATQWFALQQNDPRMSIKVMDALLIHHQHTMPSDHEKLDMIFVDLAGPVHESGLSCPPAIFLTDPVLRNMKNSVRTSGVVAINLVTRDEEVAQSARRSVATHFPSLFHIRSEEDVNEVRDRIGHYALVLPGKYHHKGL